MFQEIVILMPQLCSYRIVFLITHVLSNVMTEEIGVLHILERCSHLDVKEMLVFREIKI